MQLIRIPYLRLPRRIAIFSRTLELGGAERVALKLAQGLQQRGLGIDLVLAERRGALLDQIPKGVRTFELGSAKMSRAAPRMARYLRRYQPDAVISHMSMANVATLLARKLARSAARVIAVEHTHFASAAAEGKTSRLRRWLMRRTYRRADAVVAVSQGAASDLEEQLSLPNGLVHAIYNPIVDDALLRLSTELPDHTWMNDHGPPVLLAVGRLDPAKRFDRLIHAFAILHRREPVRLVILGEGPMREQLESLIRELNVAEDVSMPGAVLNPYCYMRRAATVVLSSDREGLGVVLVEALAVGAPCVAVDCPSGPSEILDGGRYGFLVPMGDDRLLADALERSIDSRYDRAALRRRGAEFSVDAAVDRYLDLLGWDRSCDLPAARSA